MKVNEAGYDLIKRAEGLELSAYRDAVGIWTIGYGHTSKAGLPIVRPGLKITKQEANEILVRDVDKFAQGVADLVKVPLTDNQFSALVSFAYNVGLGAFKNSSVLREVNAKRFSLVPRRLSLWIKAGNKTLPGLVKRREAEGKLFLKNE